MEQRKQKRGRLMTKEQVIAEAMFAGTGLTRPLRRKAVQGGGEIKKAPRDLPVDWVITTKGL